MAFTITAAAYGFSTTSAATLTSGSFSAAIGDFLIVSVTADNAGTNGATSISSVSDSASNTWTLRSNLNRDPGSANAGVSQKIYTTTVTSTITSGTVTVSFSPNTTNKTCYVHKFVPSSGKIPAIRAVDAGTTGSSASPTYTSSSATSGDVVFAVLSAESVTNITADSDTSNGNWSTRDWVIATTEASTHIQYKVTTGTGTQTYNPTISASATDYCINTLILYEDVSAPTYTLTGEGGTYTISETDATLAYGRVFTADTIAYTISGTDATLTYARAISNDGASYTINGQDVTLTKGGVPTGLTMSVDSASYFVSGTDATFKYTYVIAANVSNYGINGTDVSLQKGQTMTGDAGSYSISGTDTSFLRGYVLSSDTSSYTISGIDNNFLYGYDVVAASGSYSVTGGDVIFGAGQRRFSVLSGEYTITGKRAAVYWNPGSTYTLVGPDPGIKFWSNPDGLVVSYPRLISFLKYIRRPTNINGNGNVMVTTDAGSGLFSSVGHLRVTLVDGSSYVGIFAADGSVNALLITDPSGEPDQLFDPCGALRIIEADADDSGAYADNGALYVVNLR